MTGIPDWTRSGFKGPLTLLEPPWGSHDKRWNIKDASVPMSTVPLDVREEAEPYKRDNAAAVVMDNLRKTYGELVAVDDACFAVTEGEIFGIVGPTEPERPPRSSA